MLDIFFLDLDVIGKLKCCVSVSLVETWNPQSFARRYNLPLIGIRSLVVTQIECKSEILGLFFCNAFHQMVPTTFNQCNRFVAEHWEDLKFEPFKKNEMNEVTEVSLLAVYICVNV